MPPSPSPPLPPAYVLAFSKLPNLYYSSGAYQYIPVPNGWTAKMTLLNGLPPNFNWTYIGGGSLAGVTSSTLPNGGVVLSWTNSGNLANITSNLCQTCPATTEVFPPLIAAPSNGPNSFNVTGGNEYVEVSQGYTAQVTLPNGLPPNFLVSTSDGNELFGMTSKNMPDGSVVLTWVNPGASTKILMSLCSLCSTGNIIFPTPSPPPALLPLQLVSLNQNLAVEYDSNVAPNVSFLVSVPTGSQMNMGACIFQYSVCTGNTYVVLTTPSGQVVADSRNTPNAACGLCPYLTYTNNGANTTFVAFIEGNGTAYVQYETTSVHGKSSAGVPQWVYVVISIGGAFTIVGGCSAYWHHVTFRNVQKRKR